MRLLKLIAAFTLFSLVCVAQEKQPEPEFDGVFFRLDAGKLVSLEQETATIQVKGGSFFVASAKAAWVIPGRKSPVRFPSSQPLEFVVRSPLVTTAVDPNTFFVLRRLDSKKKTREIVFMTGHFSPIGGSEKTNLSEGVLPVTFSRYGKSSYEITTAPLPPGEYALSASYGQTVYCFGTD